MDVQYGVAQESGRGENTLDGSVIESAEVLRLRVPLTCGVILAQDDICIVTTIYGGD